MHSWTTTSRRCLHRYVKHAHDHGCLTLIICHSRQRVSVGSHADSHPCSPAVLSRTAVSLLVHACTHARWLQQRPQLPTRKRSLDTADTDACCASPDVQVCASHPPVASRAL